MIPGRKKCICQRMSAMVAWAGKAAVQERTGGAANAAPGTWYSVPGHPSTRLQSGADEIASIALAAMLLLSTLLTELRPAAETSTQPHRGVCPMDRGFGCKSILGQCLRI